MYTLCVQTDDERSYMEWQGHNSVSGLVEKRVREAAILNPGPMRAMSFRIPLSSEARLMVLADVLKTPKATLIRELVMASLLEAEDKILEEVLDGEDARNAYHTELEKYRVMLSDGVVQEPGLSIGAELVNVEPVGEGEVK